MMNNLDYMSDGKKICKQCNAKKDPFKDFYSSLGKFRRECKACTIKNNTTYAKNTQAWKKRKVDPQEIREYFRDYYQRNQKKFIEYRQTFKNKHPNYYQTYIRKPKKTE